MSLLVSLARAAVLVGVLLQLPRVAAASASYFLQDLQVEHLHAPADSVTLLAIDVPRPRLSWRLVPFSGLRGVSQSAYRVIVESAQQNIWDSGRVHSNETNLVECCALTELSSDTEYSWSVESWDHNGVSTNSSSSFHTGLFNGSSWRGSDWLGAKWITTGLHNDLLRSSSLHVVAPVASASVFVAGVGYFELRVNGKRVGNGRKFDPGWTEYAKRTNYVAFDIRSFLEVGQNVIAVELGNSWYQEAGWYQRPPYYFQDRNLKMTLGCSTAAASGRHGQGSGTCNGGGFAWPNPNQLLLRAKIILTTGTVVTYTSGQEGWTAGKGPIVFNSIYDGEHYNATLEQPGWDQPAFTPSPGRAWTPAAVVEDIDNALANATLSSQLYEPIRVVEEEIAHSTWISNGSYMFDFGRNMVGVIRLKITQPVAGRTVTLKHAEVKMHPPFGPADGSLYYGSLRNAHATDYYTMKGDGGVEIYEPKFTSHGFRYLELSGLPYAPQEGDVVRLITHSDVTSRSSLRFNEGGAEILNSITQGCRNSIVGNLLGGPGSCGGRDERQFFTGDTNFAGEASLLHYDLAAIYANWVRMAGETQLPPDAGPIAGSVGDFAPLTVGRRDGGHTNWASGLVTMAYFVWHLHADTAVIKHNLDRLERYVEFNERVYNASGGLRDFKGGCINGWITIGKTPNCATMTGFAYVNDYRLMAEMTSAIGAPSAAHYAALFKARIAEFHSAFFNENASTYGHGTQSELAMALWLGVPPSAAIERSVAAQLVAEIKALILSTVNLTSSDAARIDFVGGVGLVYLFEALAKTGHSDVALQLALKTSYPSYGYMFENKHEPSTTLWELWDSDIGSPTMDSRNHIYSASIGTFMYKVLGGIQAAAPGFAQVLIAPYVPAKTNATATPLRSVEASVGTPFGRVFSSWTTDVTPVGPMPPTPPYPDSCSNKTTVQCDIQEEGKCATCAHVCVGCSHAGAKISAIVYANFGSASPDVRPSMLNCSSPMQPLRCSGGTVPKKCHPCTNCPKCTPEGNWPNATAIVESMCLGKSHCSIPVDFQVFGDPCDGKKVLAVQVQCSSAQPQPTPTSQIAVEALYRHTVTVPPGSVADVDVPLLGHNTGDVAIMESGQPIWQNGTFIAGVQGVKFGSTQTTPVGLSTTVRFSIVQGTYVFEVAA